MELALNTLVLLLDICLAMAALMLVIIFSGSTFFSMSRYLLILALSLTAHALSEIFLSGQLGFFVYGITASVASLSYLLVVYGIFIVLKNISERGSA